MSHNGMHAQGVTVAPHRLAAQSGLEVLREGGNAADAAVAMAAVLSVVYPHMTGLGGDGFWLLAGPDGPVTAVDASGRAARGLDPEAYRARSAQMPQRGARAASTVAGAVSGWQAALAYGRARWSGGLPLRRLLADAIHQAQTGYTVCAGQAECTVRKRAELEPQPGFVETFGQLGADDRQRQPALARTLIRLADAGLDDFYRGELAASMAAELAALGSPLARPDFARHRAGTVAPLALELGGRLSRNAGGGGTLFTTPAPTQGLATLLILGQFDRATGIELDTDDARWVHFLVEATKSAFETRDRLIADPAVSAPLDHDALLSADALRQRAATIDPGRARPWPDPHRQGDTTWFGAIDRWGQAVSCIQSLYHEFGSGVVLRDTGICWHNRSASFSLQPGHLRALAPGRKPFHTLCPSLARLADGRMLVFGTMGGDGQPQTQAALASRYLAFGHTLQEAVAAPRWVLGRTWGAGSDTLKLESRFPAQWIQALRDRGHEVDVVAPFDAMMGHAGALVRHGDGALEGAHDPRSDGAVAAF